LAVQLPTYKIESTQDLWTMPITAGGAPSTCGVGSAGFSPLGKAIRIYCQPMLQISAQT
jgi:hypothetical protein